MTVAAVRIQREQAEKDMIQQEAIAKQINQAEIYQIGCNKAKQEMELLMEWVKQLQNSVDLGITKEKRLKQEVAQWLKEEEWKSACLEGQKRQLKDQIKESSKRETAHQSKNEVLLGKLQDAEQRLRSMEEANQPPVITSSTRTVEPLDYPIDALDTLPFSTFIPPSSRTHLSGRWIMGETGMIWITYNHPLPWVVPRNTLMMEAHWYDQYFQEHGFTLGQHPDTAESSESCVTTAYIEPECNPEGICPLEAEDDDDKEKEEEVDKLPW
jgi:hypothetical protein